MPGGKGKGRTTKVVKNINEKVQVRNSRCRVPSYHAAVGYTHSLG